MIAAGLQDPGNLGTLVRSAEAFGATGMILLPGTVSLWNAKTLRASSGSAFRLPVVTMAAEMPLPPCAQQGVQIFAAVARDGASEAGSARAQCAAAGQRGRRAARGMDRTGGRARDDSLPWRRRKPECSRRRKRLALRSHASAAAVQSNNGAA